MKSVVNNKYVGKYKKKKYIKNLYKNTEKKMTGTLIYHVAFEFAGIK